MTQIFELYALLFEVFAFTLLVVVGVSFLIVALHCAVELARQWDSPWSRRGRRKVVPLVEIG